ncbi:hypothetical protein C4J81_15335 [Deltaproteobacteria bacterium Smac51]|nr:hypothetical protein C4J81_10070 [Deltaproteobacteria bacterium Smac51]UQZ90504.1 hypothetical protein C4J81_15335 [Deltaproteobacteria bacterium Smac51]
MFDLTLKSASKDQGQKNDQVSLMVGGKIYGGWLSFSVIRSMEAPSGSFSLTISDKWPGQRAPWAIEPGDECQLNLGGEVLVTGYIDESLYRLTANSREISVTGRDKTADLVDCSYIEKPDQWQEATVQDIAAALAAPFSIIGKVLNAFSANYKNDWGIVVSGTNISLFNNAKFFNGNFGRFPRMANGASASYQPGVVEAYAVASHKHTLYGANSAGSISAGPSLTTGGASITPTSAYKRNDVSSAMDYAGSNETRPYSFYATPAIYLGV